MKKLSISALYLFLAGFTMPAEKCNAPITVLPGSPDGPYVFYTGKYVTTKFITQESGVALVRLDSLPASEKGNLKLAVLTDEIGKEFTVQLKGQLENENVVYTDVAKQFVISDIEGNFTAFRKLLQANEIIDTSYNWTFGKGHLVLTGDFFDRGNMVTEVLWLIYSLEEKAKAAGGYVHFILGNHEIMNLSGDLRYVNKKYLDNAKLIGVKYEQLYDEHTELGRWLRTKNVIEKIGDVVYTHGGISSAVNNMNTSLSELNQLTRPYYSDSSYKYSDQRSAVLYSDLGPFWYRGYYAGANKASLSQIDSSLSIYSAQHIATGHTVIADTISKLFNGKLFDTDVHHAAGKSEGLYIENGIFYRATATGEKIIIFQK